MANKLGLRCGIYLTQSISLILYSVEIGVICGYKDENEYGKNGLERNVEGVDAKCIVE